MITKYKYKERVVKHAKIVESYREKGKTPRKRTILNLGPVNSEVDLRRYKGILASMKQGDGFIKIEDIKAKDTREFGVTSVFNGLLNKYQIQPILDKHLSSARTKFDTCEILKAIVVNRLLSPSSELSAFDWIHKHYGISFKGLAEEHLYRSLDHLIAAKEPIETQIFRNLRKNLKLNIERTYYDLTSSYFEGSKCSIALFGYSRDHRPDRKQVVLGLVMCDGIPIMHEVFEGNTADSTTLNKLQSNLKKRLGIKKTTFVADGGLTTKVNIDTLEDQGYSYILGGQRRKTDLQKELLVKEVKSPSKQSAREIYKETVKNDKKTISRRYILCLDKNTRKERLKTLEKIKSDISGCLENLKKKYEISRDSNRKNKMTKQSVMAQANQVLGKNKRLFQLDIEQGLKFSFKEDVFQYEKDIAGRFLLTTNTSLKPMEVMKAYKELQDVENAFDELKNFLDVRPIYHWKPRRVKAHIFVCVLAFLLECIIERFCNQTAKKVIRELEVIKEVRLDLNDNMKSILTEISPEAKKIYQDLKLQLPIENHPLQKNYVTTKSPLSP